MLLKSEAGDEEMKGMGTTLVVVVTVTIMLMGCQCW